MDVVSADRAILRESDSEESLLEKYAGKGSLDDLIPSLARNQEATHRIEAVVQGRPTKHELILGDACELTDLDESSVHLVVTSPPLLEAQEVQRPRAPTRARY